MIIEVNINNTTVNWNTEKKLHEQEQATEDAIINYIANNTPTTIVPDLIWGSQRKGREEYELTNHWLHVTPMYVYNNRPRTAKYKDIIEIIEK